jgi:hypothetical protein
MLCCLPSNAGRTPEVESYFALASITAFARFSRPANIGTAAAPAGPDRLTLALSRRQFDSRRCNGARPRQNLLTTDYYGLTDALLACRSCALVPNGKSAVAAVSARRGHEKTPGGHQGDRGFSRARSGRGEGGENHLARATEAPSPWRGSEVRAATASGGGGWTAAFTAFSVRVRRARCPRP